MLEAWPLGCLAANDEAPNPASQTPLPFDPIEHPHRLSATGGKHPAKRIASEFGLYDLVRCRDVLDALGLCATESPSSSLPVPGIVITCTGHRDHPGGVRSEATLG